MKNYKCILSFLMMSLVMVAQVDYVADFNQLTDYNTTDDDKVELSKQLSIALTSDLQVGNSLVDSLGIRQLKKVNSPDGLLVIYTWHYSLNDATSQYGGIIKHGDDFFTLHFNDRPVTNNQSYEQDNWCGGIYYDIIPIKQQGKRLYTLLSWDGNNGVTSKKIIDILSFDKKGNPIFGLSLFDDENEINKRVILEYPTSNSMFLEYDQEKRGIVFNATYVNDDEFDSAPAYLVVSEEFNIYRFQEKKWKFYTNVDLFMNEKESDALRGSADRQDVGL